MKSLLKFVTTEDRARDLLNICENKGCLLQHKTHGEPLTEAIIAEGGFTVNFGGYGSYSRLGVGKNFASKWEITGLDVSSGKGFVDVAVCFCDGVEEAKLKAIGDFVIKQGGTITKGNNANCDLCILPVADEGEQNLLEMVGAMVEGGKGFLLVTVDEFLGVVPVIKKPRPKTAKASQLSEELKILFKKLQERSFKSIDEALSKLAGKNADIDLLVMGVSVDQVTGELERGPKFQGTGPAMEYLDIALFGLLSLAEDKSEAGKIRRTVRKIKSGLRKLPKLDGFSSLEELEIEISCICDNEKCITGCDLTGFGSLPALKKLVIVNESGHNSKAFQVSSLHGLDSPDLEELVASNVGLQDISALERCKALRIIDLSQNIDLESIESLSCAEGIKKLFLNETSISSLLPLSSCSELEELRLNDCPRLKSLKGLNSANIIELEICNLKLKDFDGVQGLEGLTKLCVSGLHHLEDLNPLSLLGCLEELDIYRLSKLKALPCLDSLSNLKIISIRNCESLLDISALAAAIRLQQVRVDGCHGLKTAPVIWPSGLTSLSLQQTSLRELGSCPAGLKEISVSNNKNLLSIKGISQCSEPGLSRWGLDLSGCHSLEALDGLIIPGLNVITIPETISNLDALKRYSEIKITVFAGYGEEKDYRTVIGDIPEALGVALNALGIQTLTVRTAWDTNLVRISGIANLASLRVLDLSDCNLIDITGIASLNNLEFLSIKPRTELSKKLGKATFDTKGQIDKLRLKLLAGL